MSIPSQADNITMSEGGLYSLATIGAKDVIDLSTPRVLEALNQVTSQGQYKSQGQWCFSDMGCADGGTSLSLWRAVCKQCAEESDQQIQIVYADQARNDFNALVRIVHGLTEFDAYLPEYDQVRILESGASFYSSILPNCTLHLGYSATAMHWLSRKPIDISNHVHMVGASGSELDAFRVQAQQDWSTILLKRAEELRPGGRLVLVNFCIDEQGRYLGATGGVNMFENFNQNWQDMLDDGLITLVEYQSMTLPQYYNTVEEFSAPLLDQHSDVYRAGLRLQDIETQIVQCPFAADYAKHGDAKRFAKAYVPTIRSWNESIFMASLSTERSAEQKREIIETFYGKYQAQVEAEPELHGMGYVHAYMTIEKQES